MNDADTEAGGSLPATLVQTSAQPAEVQRGPRPPTVLPLDEFHGIGGDYVIEDGIRRLETPAA